jgi:hypothetical protein
MAPTQNERRSLLDIHTHRTGKVSDKWSAYFPVYERVLAPFRDAELSMLEIGVQNGGSLEVWSEFFPNAKVIVGCDVDQRCQQLRYEDPRIKLVIADVTSQAAEAQILGHSPTFDVVIDDGSHLSGHILHSFITFFPRLKPGGLFIVEDTHSLYFTSFGGGILTRNSTQEFFKLLADLVNLEHWETEVRPETLFSTFLSPVHFPPYLKEGWVEGVEFSNSMTVVRKSKGPGGSRLGPRIISGDLALVNEKPLKMDQTYLNGDPQ